MVCHLLLWLLLAQFGTVFSAGASHTCKTSAVVERQILGNGFHKDVETTVSFVSMDPLCSLSLMEQIVPDLYIDKYQLNSLQEKNLLVETNVRIANYSFSVEPQNIDVESPSFVTDFALDKPRSFTFQQNISVISKVSQHEKLRFVFKHPIHVRYHEPKFETFFTDIKLKAAISVIVGTCDNEYYSSCIDESNFKNISIPVGRTEHKMVVSLVTLTITCLSAAYVILSVKTS